MTTKMTRSEADDHARQRRKGRPRKKRMPTSLGRYPFVTVSNRYLQSSGLGEYTRAERERRLRYIHRDIRDLSAAGQVRTSNPEKMGEEDVGALVQLWLGRGVNGKTLAHLVTALNAVLEFAGNGVVRSYRTRHANLFRHSGTTERKPPLSIEQSRRITSEAEKVDYTDWKGMESFAIVVLALASGGRHKELRMGRLDDLHLTPGQEHYHISHPKGEGTYGEARDVPLRPECVPFLLRYVDKRKEEHRMRPHNPYLLPSLNRGDGPLSSNVITSMVRWVGHRSGVPDLSIRTCRRTYGQFLLDEGAGIETVSVLLGHKTTRTTELSYCRRRQDIAIKQARLLWSHLGEVTGW